LTIFEVEQFFCRGRENGSLNLEGIGTLFLGCDFVRIFFLTCENANQLVKAKPKTSLSTGSVHVSKQRKEDVIGDWVFQKQYNL